MLVCLIVCIVIVVGSSWAQGMNISWDTGRTDWEIFRRLQKRFEQLKDSTCKSNRYFLAILNVSII